MISSLNITIAILLLVASYLIGSIPFGIVFGKLFKGIDIRKLGSKNIGTTNAIRFLGKKLGFTVFFFDVLKGMVVILLIKYVLEPLNIWISPIDYFFYGVAAILGHVFSIYLNFKGGKAVATSLGVVLCITPLPAILCLVAFLIILYTIGYVSLASTGATITVVVTAWILYFFGVDPNNGFVGFILGKPSLLVATLYTITSLLIIFKHRSNYIRIINKTEHNVLKKNKD